jgi:hypothetical protein
MDLNYGTALRQMDMPIPNNTFTHHTHMKTKLKKYMVTQTTYTSIEIMADSESAAIHKMRDKISMYHVMPENEPQIEKAIMNSSDDYSAYEITTNKSKRK